MAIKLTPQQKHIGAALVQASQQLAGAKRLGTVGGTLAQNISATCQATARRKIADLVDLAAKYTPSIAKDEAPEGDRALLEYVGVSRGQLPAILKALGASDYDIKQAVADPAEALRLLAQFAKERRTA